MTRTYNAFSHIKSPRTQTRINHVGSVYMDKGTGETYLLVDSRIRNDWREYTAYAVLSDEPPVKLSVTNNGVFDNPLQEEIDTNRDDIYEEYNNVFCDGVREWLVGPFINGYLDTIRNLLDAYTYTVAILSSIIEDATEATDDELFAMHDALHLLTTDTDAKQVLISSEVVQLALYAKRKVTQEINSRMENIEVELDDEIPFDGRSRIVARRNIGAPLQAASQDWRQTHDTFADFLQDEFADRPEVNR